jgi:GYF domain 2
MPTEQWYYRLDGKPHGPFTAAQFEKLIRGHTVVPETEVSTDGQTWQTLRQAMAGVPADAPVDPAEWMNAPTLVPGEVRLPPGWKDERKPDPPG